MDEGPNYRCSTPASFVPKQQRTDRPSVAGPNMTATEVLQRRREAGMPSLIDELELEVERTRWWHRLREWWHRSDRQRLVNLEVDVMHWRRQTEIAREEMLRVSRELNMLRENDKGMRNKYGQIKGHLRAHRITVGHALKAIEDDVLPDLLGFPAIAQRLETVIDQVRSAGVPPPYALEGDAGDVPSLPVELEVELKLTQDDADKLVHRIDDQPTEEDPRP